MRLVAVAGRAVVARPVGVDAISSSLGQALSGLSPPARLAAEECFKLWEVFVRVAKTPKDALRLEAGKALCRDLDKLGQRLELAPLDRWERLPEAMDDPQGVGPDDDTDIEIGESLEVIKAAARHKARKTKDPPLGAKEVLRLLMRLAAGPREELFEAAVGEGDLTRSDAALVNQTILTEDRVGPDDEMLIEALEALGRWLVK